MTNKEIKAMKDRLTKADSLISRVVRAIDSTPTALHVTNRNPGRDNALALLSDLREYVREMKGERA